MFVGGLPVALGVLLCRTLCFRAFCGIYEEKGMIEVLRIARGLLR
jgi:hypothetical protein